MGRFRSAFGKLVYMSNGEFSMTRIIMVVTAVSGIALIWIGILAKLLWDITLPTNLYSYVGGLMGGGIVQYGATKFFNQQSNGGATNGNTGPEQTDKPVAVVNPNM